MKKALITGITGQDGSYLAEFLLNKGYEVYGIKRRASSLNTERIDHLYDNKRFSLIFGDLTDSNSMASIIQDIQPDEIYNLGAQSHVRVSFDLPEYTTETMVGTLRLLEAVRLLGMGDKVKFYQASTSELFGEVEASPQNENTPFHPCSPYGVSKLFAYWAVRNYREAYNFFACNGILFNHESPRRGETFVTRKITRVAARIKYKLDKKLSLGCLDAKRDWGFAGDYVEAMWLMLQQKKAEDFVIATGESHSVREFVEKVFAELDMPLEWKGKDCNEKGIDKKTGKTVIEIDPRYFRPKEVSYLCGDASKARKKLGWKPKVSFAKLVKLMVEHDVELARKEVHLKKGGFECSYKET